MEWPWSQNGGTPLSHGWRPGRGFLPYHWTGYNEALILYLLALGSPTHPVRAEAYGAWTSSYKWKRIYGHDYLYAGPMFIHQLTHAWVDFREIQDGYMRERHSNYFENSRRATLVQQQYAIRNPRGWDGYGETAWGITASDGPGPAQKRIGGRPRRFYGYRATFNSTFPSGSNNPAGWVSPWFYGLNEGTVVPMIENYRAGFTGGWL